MNPEQNGFDELDAAVGAMQSQSTTGPSEDLLASTVEALQAQDSTDRTSNDARASRRDMMFRFAKFGSLGVAATLALVFFGSTLLSGLTGQSAFAEMMDKIRDAKGASYSLVQKFGDLPKMDCQGSFSGKIVRTEVPGQFIYLANVETREMLQLMPNEKTAIQGKVAGGPQQPMSIPDLMQDMTEDDTKLLKTIDEDGKTIDVYEVTKMPAFMGMNKLSDKDSFKIWVNRETQLPTKVSIRTAMGVDRAVAIEMDFSNFKWDPKFPADHFKMKVPTGYEIQTTRPVLPAAE